MIQILPMCASPKEQVQNELAPRVDLLCRVLLHSLCSSHWFQPPVSSVAFRCLPATLSEGSCDDIDLRPRLCSKRIDFFRPDGSLMDLAHPEACEIDFNEVAFGLAKINRFTGTYPGVGYSDAQHCVMGAQALLREGEDELTAALFLLHDAHEYKLGDDSRPKQDLVAAMLDDFSPKSAEAYRSVVASAKAGWDSAIYAAAGLPAPSAWTKKQAHAVERMDVRMAAAEAESLSAPPRARSIPYPGFPLP